MRSSTYFRLTRPRIYALLYLFLVPVYAAIYYVWRADFYHSTVTQEPAFAVRRQKTINAFELRLNSLARPIAHPSDKLYRFGDIRIGSLTSYKTVGGDALARLDLIWLQAGGSGTQAFDLGEVLLDLDPPEARGGIVIRELCDRRPYRDACRAQQVFLWEIFANAGASMSEHRYVIIRDERTLADLLNTVVAAGEGRFSGGSSPRRTLPTDALLERHNRDNSRVRRYRSPDNEESNVGRE